MVRVQSEEELLNLLLKARQIEAEFESISAWEGYIDVSRPELRELIFRLISDSERHRSMVDSLLSKLRTRSSDSPQLQSRQFNFKNLSELEVMMELQRYDKLALDIYSSIHKALENTDLSRFVEEGAADAFLTTLSQLMHEEMGHIELISRYVGKVERIR